MKDLAIDMDDRPGALADLGEAFGRAGVSIEGGGAWVVGGRGVAHFLFADGAAARAALEAKGVIFPRQTAVIPGKVALAEFKDPDGNRLRFAGPAPAKQP